MKYIHRIIIIIFLTLSFNLSAQFYYGQHVFVDDANVRETPSLSAKKLGTLKEGVQIEYHPKGQHQSLCAHPALGGRRSSESPPTSHHHHPRLQVAARPPKRCYRAQPGPYRGSGMSIDSYVSRLYRGSGYVRHNPSTERGQYPPPPHDLADPTTSTTDDT